MKPNDLSIRIRRYEDAVRLTFPPRTPILLRVDGRAFHTVTRGFQKPIDARIEECMDAAACGLLQASGGMLAYTQSDEITVLLTPYKLFASEAWFGGGQQKLASVSASVASAEFSHWAGCLPAPVDDREELLQRKIRRATFDGRAFPVPREDVTNAFLTRQQDCWRNAILGQAQAVFGKKNLHKLGAKELLTRLEAEGKAPDERALRGRVVIRHSAADATGLIRTAMHIVQTAPNFGAEPWFVNELVWPKDEEGNEKP